MRSAWVRDSAPALSTCHQLPLQVSAFLSVGRMGIIFLVVGRIHEMMDVKSQACGIYSNSLSERKTICNCLIPLLSYRP